MENSKFDGLSVNEKIKKLNELREVTPEAITRIVDGNGYTDVNFSGRNFMPNNDDLARWMVYSYERMELSESIIKDLVNQLWKKEKESRWR